MPQKLDKIGVLWYYIRHQKGGLYDKGYVKENV